MKYQSQQGTARKHCPEHLSHTINPKYGKCYQCRIDDGDLVLCDKCGINYRKKNFATCYECYAERREN